MKARALVLKIVVAALAMTASSLWAQDGLEGALSRLASPANLGRPFPQTLAAADFDGDKKPDGAILVDDGWLISSRTIELHLTGHGNTALTFESSEAALAVSAVDVNKDGAADIVVEQPFTHKHLHVWLNDGRGGFHKVRSEDFPSTDAASRERLQPPSQRLEFPALCLPPQRGSVIALATVSPLPYDSSSAHKESRPFKSPIGSRAVAPNPPRAPPLFESYDRRVDAAPGGLGNLRAACPDFDVVCVGVAAAEAGDQGDRGNDRVFVTEAGGDDLADREARHMTGAEVSTLIRPSLLVP